MRYLRLYSQESINFIRFCNSNLKLSTIALAKFLADKMVVPSEPVTNVEELYNEVAKNKNFDILIRIIECCPIEMSLIEKYVRDFYISKYHIVHAHVRLLDTKSGVLDFYGISHLISSDEIKLINDNSSVLVQLYNGYCKWVPEIEKIIESKRC